MADLLSEIFRREKQCQDLRKAFHDSAAELKAATVEWHHSASSLFYWIDPETGAVSANDFCKNDLEELLRLLLLTKAIAAWCDCDRRSLGQERLHEFGSMLDSLTHLVRHGEQSVAHPDGLGDMLDATRDVVSRIDSVAEHECSAKPDAGWSQYYEPKRWQRIFKKAGIEMALRTFARHRQSKFACRYKNTKSVSIRLDTLPAEVQSVLNSGAVPG